MKQQQPGHVAAQEWGEGRCREGTSVERSGPGLGAPAPGLKAQLGLRLAGWVRDWVWPGKRGGRAGAGWGVAVETGWQGVAGKGSRVPVAREAPAPESRPRQPHSTAPSCTRPTQPQPHSAAPSHTPANSATAALSRTQPHPGQLSHSRTQLHPAAPRPTQPQPHSAAPRPHSSALIHTRPHPAARSPCRKCLAQPATQRRSQIRCATSPALGA
eukprot:363804-Chlamydomonas_euryale.AAC.6